MSVPDAMALYGAVLATVIAIIQYQQWLRSRQALIVTPEREFSDPPNHLSITITNRESIKIYISYVGLGYGYRPWLWPWRLRHHESLSMKATEGDFLSDKGAGGLLEPGDFMETHFTKEDFSSLTRPGARLGFDAHLCVWIDHSGADSSLCKAIS